MKLGTVIRKFTATDGREVVLRTPTWSDLDDLLDFINSLVEERADILMDEKVSREDESEWLSKALARLEKDETFYLVAEVNGKVVGNSEVSRKTKGYDRYTGTIGVAIRHGYRDLGIGTEMIKILIERARAMNLKVLTLSAFASNDRARHVYEEAGFSEAGRITKKFFKEGRYIDEILMVKVLE